MAGLRRLLNGPGLLADDSHPGRVLAQVAGLALCCADPAVDGHVGGHAGHHLALQESLFLLKSVGVATGRGAGFSLKQLGGVPELHGGQQHLITTGIRKRSRHPVYLGHLLEMLAWSIGTGLIVCLALTAFAMLTGAVMIRAEDAELEQRFGVEYARYREAVPAVLPRPSNITRGTDVSQ